MTETTNVRRGQTSQWLMGLVALVLTTLSVIGTRNVAVEADVVGALAGNSEGYLAYEAFQDRFMLGLADEALLVRADDLADPEAFEALENLILDLQFTDGVAEVVSLFSLPAEGVTTPLILANPDAPLADRFDAFAAAGPAAGALVTADRSAALLHVIAVPGAESGDIAVALPDLIESAAPLSVFAIGQAEVERQISANLIRDQLLVTPVAVLICILVGFVLLRSLRAVMVCAAPAICGVLWFTGCLGWAGQSLDPWLATLPMLVMVLAFADTLHLFYACQEDGGGVDRAVRQVMPAAFMTSLTSALALASFGFAGSDALWGLAVWGPVAVFSGFAAVCIFFPLLTRLLIHEAIKPPAPFAFVMARAQGGLLHPRTMAVVALVFVIGLIPGLNSTEPNFSLSEHIRDDSRLGHDLAFMEAEGLGSASLFIVIDDTDGEPGLSAADSPRIAEAAGIALSGTGAAPGDAPPQVPERFRASDGLAIALPVLLPLGNGPDQFGLEIDRLRAELDAAGLSDVANLAGQSLLAHEVVPETVNAMRSSFYIALAAISIVVAISQRSLMLALLATAISAMPMMAIEGVLFLTDRGMTMTAAIALTVAFGIAVDNTIHYLNRWRLAPGPKGTRLADALAHSGPPMVASTLIMTLGFSATLLSSTASMPQFGLFVMSALWMALTAALFFLPALIRLVRRKEY